MRQLRTMLRVVSVMAVISFSDLSTFGQNSPDWPAELSPSSSVSELIAWLDQKAFGNASIGLNSRGGTTQYSFGVVISKGSPSAKAIFSKDFRLSGLDGCHLTLKNTAVRVIDFSGGKHSGDVKTLLENRRTATTGQLLMWLERLSYDKGKGAYRHTKNRTKSDLLGEWRTEFTYRGFFSRNVFSMSFSDPEQGTMREVMTAEKLTFTFDDRDTAAQFDMVFRRAIKVCQQLNP